MKEIKIEIGKRELYLITSIMIFLIGAGYVIAYGGNQPSSMGHSPGEMDWSQPIPSDVSIDGTLRLIPRSSATCTASREGAMYYDSDNNQVYTCRNGVWTDYKGLTGPQGVQGPQGPQGAQGPQGNPGPSEDEDCVYYQNVDGPCPPCGGGWILTDCRAWKDFYNQYSWFCCPPGWS